jgi:predicted ferric reductase
VALVLFTMVVSLGTLVANRIGGTIVGRFEVNELHRSLSMVAVVFLVIHIVTTVLDSYVSTGLISAIIPMTSSYKRVAIAVGAVGFDLILAVWISSLLKLHIKNRSWRFIHWFSWMAFATALVHAYLSGTDARHGIGLAVIIACAFTVVLAALWRFFGRPARAAGRTALSPLAQAKNPAPVTSSARAFPSAPRPTTKRGR